MPGWVEASVRTTAAGAEAVAEALRPLAYGGGVAQEQAGDPDHPDPNALLPDISVKIYWPAQEDSPQRRDRASRAVARVATLDLGPVSPPAFRLLADVDWAEAWKSHYRPFRIGRRFWITPPWPAEPAAGQRRRAGDVTLTLDPGMAFGTGLHATTRLCLEALEGEVVAGRRVLDVGTGSGILAIAAALLGARSVVATDDDPLAVQTAVANAARNGVVETVAFLQGTLPATGHFDIVLVNILAPVIRRLLTQQALLSRGDLFILSGIIAEQEADITAAVFAGGGQLIKRLGAEEWVALVAARRQPKTP